MKRIIRWINRKLSKLLKKNRVRNILIGINSVVFIVSFTICLLKLYDYYSSQKLYSDLSRLYTIKPVTENYNKLTEKDNNTAPIEVNVPPKISDKFNDLLNINEDTVGWLSIEHTSINYPVVKHDDNDFYLDKNFEKKKSSSGCIFMDFRNDILPLDRNIILYGHHMKDKSMFTDINLYKDKDFFFNNDKIVFNNLYKENIWQVFSVYVTNLDFDYLVPKFESDVQFDNYIKVVKEKSKYKKDIEVSSDDHILTLSTCSYEFKGARTVVHAKLIK